MTKTDLGLLWGDSEACPKCHARFSSLLLACPQCSGLVLEQGRWVAPKLGPIEATQAQQPGLFDAESPR